MTYLASFVGRRAASTHFEKYSVSMMQCQLLLLRAVGSIRSIPTLFHVSETGIGCSTGAGLLNIRFGMLTNLALLHLNLERGCYKQVYVTYV